MLEVRRITGMGKVIVMILMMPKLLVGLRSHESL